MALALALPGLAVGQLDQGDKEAGHDQWVEGDQDGGEARQRKANASSADHENTWLTPISLLFLELR